MRLAFEDCVLDTEERRLYVEGRDVPLRRLAYELLALLLASAPRAVPRAALVSAIWPDVTVSDGALTRLVWEVRQSIRDDQKGRRAIRTLPRFGYAFDAHVTCADEAPVELSRARAS